MKAHVTMVALALGTAPLLAQEARTGVSNPEPVVINAAPEETVTVKVVPAKPSPAVPATPRPLAMTAPAGGEVYGPYVPYRGASAMPASAPRSGAPADPDAMIVTGVEEVPGEVREGTLLRVRTRQTLSTVMTAQGTPFTAELTEPVIKDGRVVLPVGALLEGRVTDVHGGRRISGAAMLHLEPKSVTLPDGTHYRIHAQLIDTNYNEHTRVDREGSLLRRDHAKETLAIVGGTTGAAAVAGGMIGGGFGAAVGAGLGAGASAIVWLKQDRQATLPEQTLLVFSLTAPMDLRPASDGAMPSPISRVDPDSAVVGDRTGSISSQP